MNIQNYQKYFSTHKVVTSSESENSFGIMEVAEIEDEVEGYIFKKPTSNSQITESLPTAMSSAILFTMPSVLLYNGDIIDDKYQVVDGDKFPSHNEYYLSYKDKWNK